MPSVDRVVEEVPLEMRCIECGKERTGMCTCCGANLCSMHCETQAHFCSRFSTHSFSEGDIVKLRMTDLENQPEELDKEVVYMGNTKITGCYIELENEPDEIYVFPERAREKDKAEKITDKKFDRRPER